MPRVATGAAADQQQFYDARYATGRYMTDFADLYEACRSVTVTAELQALDVAPARVLDYGCGEARYFDLLRDTFPAAQILGCDISKAALERATERHPEGTFRAMVDETAPIEDGTIDLVLSVEVLEHVRDVGRAVHEVGRVLAPGGVAVLTTPCANPWSLEWTLNRLRRNGLQESADGYGRFATDEPGHLRRLQSRDLAVLLLQAGLRIDHFAFRAHLFTTLVAARPAQRLLPMRVRQRIALLDWRLWRARGAAATMIAVARKPAAGGRFPPAGV
jgi:SAM-dependent methyltransferase